ncbi:hypothetical protein B0A48_04423 [Cryoendolithus antarcticus]|uniref:Xylanolytic transcriptional activator regulatory domain-containing protein n=1 Tax=Cryoendolithus antarcticus TaxID=1507870 RepID=A0A1V8TFA9_9PEZI|nr:hypothetical protein B0A48_04423 [Cryoendolithus antarcticus]
MGFASQAPTDSTIMAASTIPLASPDDWDAAFNSAFPAFFESIMVPNQTWVGGDDVMVPPELSAMIPEQEDWIGSSSIFDIDFSLAIDKAMDPLPAAVPMHTHEVDVIGKEHQRTMKPNESARQRHSIFLEDSPWQVNSIPTLDNGVVARLRKAANLLYKAVDAWKRFQCLVIKTANSQISVPTFPSNDCLELLLKVGITKRLESDAWIHPYTFSSDNTRTELLVALIAAGCVCFGVPSISRTGLVLLEIARVALASASEEDNSSVRDLQYLQASMIWLDVCGFCGYKRKMEIAESNLQPVITALRRFGKLDKVAYEEISPSASDSPEVTEALWRRWAQQESFKRLVYHLFEHDMLMTIARHRQCLISYAELTVPLPASRDLWLAPSAETWRTLYLENMSRTNSTRVSSVSLRSLLSTNDVVQFLPQNIDRTLAATTFLYGIAAQIWEYNQQATVLKEQANGGDPSNTLWLQARQHSLSQKLRDFEPSLANLPATTRLIHAFLMMILNIDIDTVMRFAGKCGELEAHRAYHDLQVWVKGKSARVAVWHAAQAMRAAKAVPPFQLRGADSFVTYHAVMVLWTYGMLCRDSARRTGTNTPASSHRRSSPPGLLRTQSVTQVVLDDIKDESTDVFVHTGDGRPCIRFPDGRVCELRNPSSVLAVGSATLQANCPTETRDGMPQLIKSLCTLMDDLGNLR